MVGIFNFKEELAKYGLTDETFEQCLKDSSEKVQKNNEMEWQEIVEKYNLGIHYDTLRKSQQPTPFGGAFIREYYMNKMSTVNNEDNYLKELQLQKRELEKEKIKMRDERNELSRLLREQARRESFIDMVKRQMETVEPIDLNYSPTVLIESDNDLIIHLTDIHTGIGIKNYFNVFNNDVLTDRLRKYLDKIHQIQKRHNSENCFLVLGGDLISGLIHSSLRIENNENVIEQVMTASTLISDFAIELSKIFNNVNIFSTAGNHGRCMPNKEDSLKGENLDVLIPFYMKARLQNCNNVKIFDNTIEESVAMFTVRGNLINATHGDKDSVNNVVQRFTMMFNAKPKVVLMGHRHTNGMTTIFNTKVIESGCVSGNDNYCLDHRLLGRPEQTVLVMNNEGIDCLYDIQLD